MTNAIAGQITRHLSDCLRGFDPRPGFGNFHQPLPEPHRFSLGVGMPSVEEPPAKDANPHTLLVFLQSQPKKALSRLYQRPSSCLCIFRFLLYSRLVEAGLTDATYTLRLLGPLERQIVMNILWLDASIPASTMSSWVVREGKKSVFWIIPSGNPLSCMPRC